MNRPPSHCPGGIGDHYQDTIMRTTLWEWSGMATTWKSKLMDTMVDKIELLYIITKTVDCGHFL